MATTEAFNIHATALTQIWNFPKLKGQESYQPWSKKMKSALKYCSLWDIVNQGLTLFPDNLPTNPQPTNEQVLAYNAAMKTWKDFNSQASELIYSMCEDKPAEAIEDKEITMNQWIKLQTDYTNSGFVLRFTKLQELWTTTMSSSNNSIETYVANIRTKSKDLKRMGAPIDSWILAALLLNNLDGKYKDFVYCLVTQLDDLPDFDKIVTLLHEEDCLLKRDNKEQAMAASMKRYQKDQEEKKTARGNNGQG